jgi:hypothetical protein
LPRNTRGGKPDEDYPAIGASKSVKIEKSVKMICWRSGGGGVAFDPTPTAYPC